MHRNSCLVLFSFFLFFCYGCRKKEENKATSKEQSVSINLSSEPQTLDPRKARTLNDINLLNMMFEGLVRTSKEGKPELALAEKYFVSSDKKSYTFILRESFWNNGLPITAYDFVYAWKKALSVDFPSSMAWQLYVIKNAKEVKEGKLGQDKLGVLASDDKTLVINLENPTHHFLELLCLPIFFPVQNEIDEKFPKWAETASGFTSNGPFCLKKWHHHDSICLVKNEKYWDRKKVKLSKISLWMISSENEFSLYENEDLDWAGSPFSDLPNDFLEKERKEDKVNIKPYLGTFFLRVNSITEKKEENDFLLNKNFRKALASSIDRGEMVDHIMQGKQIATTCLVPQEMGLHSAPLFPLYNKEYSKAVLQKAIGSKSNELISLSLMYINKEKNHLIAQCLQRNWEKNLGLQVQLLPVERKIYFEKLQRLDYQLALGSWLADFTDPINFLEVFKSKDNGTNNTGWESASYFSLLEESNKAEGKEQRRKLLSRAEKELIDNMPIIPLFHMTLNYLKRDELKNVHLSSLGHIDFKYAFKEKEEKR
jgi:oligopeptide transport system substrate-binding protein